MMEYVDPEAILDMPDDFSPENFCRIGKAPTATVEDGQVIDLSARKLEVMYTPGHSDSSIMLIDEANGILFTGDTWYPGPLYAFFGNSSLPDYVNSIQRAEKVIREKGIQWIYCSHNTIPRGTDLFFDTVDFLEEVLNGQVEGEVQDGLIVYTLNDLISLTLSADDAD